MKIHILIRLIIILSCLLIKPVPSCGFAALDKNEALELVKAWDIFLQAVSTNDTEKIKSLSVEKIRCLACLDNSEDEDKEMTKQRMTEPAWYEKLYQEKIFIPVGQFCRQDYPIIFTKKFIEKLQNNKTTYAAEYFNDEKIYEVIITTTKPGEIYPGQEGCLHLFQFIKTKNGYKFWGMDTIP